MRIRLLAVLLLAASAGAQQLPTGAMLDPVAPSHAVGNFPTAAVLSPEGDRVVVLLCGWRQPGEGIQVVDRATGTIAQTLPLNAAFLGLAFAPDGKTLYASGGNDDVVHVFRWSDRRAEAEGTIALAPPKRDPKLPGTQYPAGLALSPDGTRLYVAENLSDGVAVIDTATHHLVQRLSTERYPYGVAVARNGDVYVSCWGDRTVDVFRPSRGLLTRRTRIVVGRHPSALTIAGTRLYATCATTDTIAVVDTTTNKVVATLSDAPPGAREGSTPNALAAAHGRVFVAEADNNAVAVFGAKSNKLLGRVPVDWYPSALVAAGNDVVVVNAKGRGTAPNPHRSQPDGKFTTDSTDYTLGQLSGSVLAFRAALTAAELAPLSTRVAKANGWTVGDRRPRLSYPPFKHVIYIIKENRTYDQVLGDVKGGDGDPSLQFFGADTAPNHRALAARFGLFDRFFTNAEVSAQGHNWSTAAYASDYVEKTVVVHYGKRGRTYDYEGTNRDAVVDDDDDVAAPSTGYLWDLAARKGISLRNYGEFVVHDKGWNLGVKRALVDTSCHDYPPFDLTIPDQTRADVWIREFNEFVKRGVMPALQIVRLPNDHTAGMGDEKTPTPRAYMADNDLAFGRIIEALSSSPFWRDTAVFVVEDDAQNGPDHVDSHRSLLFVISAYNRAGTIHRFVNTTDVIATMEELLGLGTLSQFDRFGRPLRGIFAKEPDLTPYKALRPAVDLNEKGPPRVANAAPEHASIDMKHADTMDDDAFNRILWAAIKGDVPYPDSPRPPQANLGR